MSATYELGPQIGSTARLGLIVLKSDERIEADFQTLLPHTDDVAGLVTRIPSETEVTREALAGMEARLTEAASMFPDSMSFDVIGYGCTSASSVIGSQQVADRIRAGRNTTHVTNPLAALQAACEALSIRKLAVLTPYTENVTDGLISVLETSGVSCPQVASFNEAEEARVARIPPTDVANAARALAQNSDADAVFLSCTNLNTFSVIADLEQELGKPVLSSNSVLFWHMFRLAGLTDLADSGRLGQLYRHS